MRRRFAAVLQQECNRQQARVISLNVYRETMKTFYDLSPNTWVQTPFGCKDVRSYTSPYTENLSVIRDSFVYTHLAAHAEITQKNRTPLKDKCVILLWKHRLRKADGI